MKNQKTKYTFILITIIGWIMLCQIGNAIANGDLNNDGMVNLNDAIPVLQVMVDLYTPTAEELSRGDFDGNGKIGVEDAIGILQSVAGIRSDMEWTDVNVTPPAAILTPNSTQSFAAAVSGIQDQRISWKIEEGDSGGKVSDNGIYTAPSATGLYYLVATSLADPEISIKVPISVISPPPSDPGAREILSLAYYHVQDSDGSKFRDDVICVLVFELDGNVYLYVAAPTEALAYKGSYSYTSGKLALKFTAEDFKSDVEFSLDLESDTVTMPFNVLSAENGSSTWQKKQTAITENLPILFYAIMDNEPQYSIPSAIERVRNYANTRILAERQIYQRIGRLENKSDTSPEITGTEPLYNGIKILFDADHPRWSLALFSWSPNDSANIKLLQPSSLFYDPRVHIDPMPPGISLFDPLNKKVLFIAPFYSVKTYWFEKGIVLKCTDNWEENAMEDILSENGYRFKALLDEDVNLKNLIDELLYSPGIIAFNTHGMGDGTLATGIYLGSSLDDTNAILEAFNQAKESLSNTEYKDMPHDAIDIMSIHRDRKDEDGNVIFSKYVSITPKFWKWLRTRNGFKTQLDSSLVYMATCLTDRTPDLREAIRSRAYFAFSEPGPPKLAGAIFQYIVKHLSRNTHSAEEAYYNMIRVVNTQQKTYKEDFVFDNVPLKSAKLAGYPDPTELVNFFHGYFLDDNEMKSYKKTGWLSQEGSQGDIWWLTFSGRWGTENTGPEAGADGLMECWNNYWSQGVSPGLQSPSCKNKEPGQVPTRDEVAYATYLITGTPRLPFSGIKADRWTLNDAE